ncbi:MAG: tRNA pseudouridine(38-40) synthase TruA [Actinocrinis sp.]
MTGAVGATTRIRLDLAYDGTEFAGWARQRSGVRTVQAVLEEALTAVLRLPEPARLTVAGRTDAGVHATGQVAHLDVQTGIWIEHADKLLYRLAGKLPLDVRVWGVRAVPADFDARFAALSRRYVYRVGDSRYGVEPTRRRFVLWHAHELDVDAMNEAGRLILGEHDFAAYCKKREGATTIRRLLRLEWARTRADEVEAVVGADAFCHSMVRALVAAMLMVGDGRRPAAFPAEVLGSLERHSGVNVVPPHGLSLEEVRYPADDELAARTLEARRMRTLCQ